MTVVAPPPTPAQPTAPPPARVPLWRRPWIVPLGLVAVIFIGFSLPRYLTFDPALSMVPVEGSPAIHYPFVVGHVIFGSIAMITCCLQVWPWLRQHHPKVHRVSGRVYVIAGVLPSGVMGLVIGAIAPFGPVIQVSNIMLALLWLGTTAAGFRAARRRRFREHRRWMVRSFALTMSIVLNRVLMVPAILWLLPQADTTFEGSDAMFMMAISGIVGWTSWTVALIAAQLWLDRSPARHGR
ncbi:putative membrane protein DUF2306 [Stackebrandtia albiflava]|uniref:Putative membrane protein DUF2306 n=1 Tax=Stackebrandtia albiflava TaxID=406432 RepID=A0A562UPN3_9ACTN|nr:DUF2306 domain-containing protein [Stackebrandtia albiflava]TWJ07570.1 putative membrane protein DUF2306 [Stackebrandtia albiflava]